MNHIQQLESILFAHGEPMSMADICRMLHIEMDTLRTTLTELSTMYENRGMVLLVTGDMVALTTHPDIAPILDAYRKEELSTELSKASLETLAIVVYKQSVTRGEIDFIRGVNSQFILRNLVVRGLIERLPDPTDSRRSLYSPTLDLVRFLGVTAVDQLPDYGLYMERLQNALQTTPKE